MDIRKAMKRLKELDIEPVRTAAGHYKLYRDGKLIGLMPPKWKDVNCGYQNFRSQMRKAGVTL